MSARAKILEVAKDLFYSNGIKAIGVDTIIASSEVAKTTLYHHFKSKDDLVLAYLEAIDSSYWSWWDRAISKSNGSPEDQVLSIFQALAKKVCSAKYRGCPFINALVEYPNTGHPVRKLISRNKKEVLHRFESLAQAMRLKEPQMVATQLMLLMEGTYNLPMMANMKHLSESLVTAAAVLIKH